MPRIADEDKKVYVLFDQPHVLKSLASMLRSHKEFKLPEDFVTKHALPSNVVKIEHIQKLEEDMNKNNEMRKLFYQNEK